MGPSLGIGAFEYKLPLKQTLEKVVELDMEYCELVTPGNVTTENWQEAARLVEDYQLSVTAIASLTKLNSTDDIPTTQATINHSIICAKNLGAPFVITYFGGHPSRPYDEAIQKYKESIQPCLEQAEKNEVTILIENHFSHAPGEVTNTVEGCLELLQTVDSPYFQLNFDPCNYVIGGVEYYPHAYNKLKPYIKNVHMKDTLKYDPDVHRTYEGRIVNDVNQGDFIFTKLGAGILNGDNFMKKLIADGYQGPITIEAHTPDDTLDDVFRTGIQYCRERMI